MTAPLIFTSERIAPSQLPGESKAHAPDEARRGLLRSGTEGSPGLDPACHRFHRVKGEFLSVQLVAGDSCGTIVSALRDGNGQVVYRSNKGAPV